MKKFILSLTLLCFSAHAFASNTVLLVSPLVQIDERELPMELHEGYVSYSQYYLNNFPKEKNVESLLNDFETAQKYYFVKSYDLARQYYEKVIAFSDRDEWRELQRKVIFLSFLRLAEISPRNADEWVLEALRFSQDIDPKKLDISNEMIKKINGTKKYFLKQSIDWHVSQFKNSFSYILINGHMVDLKKIEMVKIPSGKFRVTFLSDIYKVQTYQVSSQQIPLLVPTQIPFVSGSCERPFVNNEGDILDDLAVYYSKTCIKTLVNSKWVGRNESKVAALEPLTPSPLSLSTKIDDDPIYKKKWFWITVGLVSAAAMIYSNGKKDEKKPTHETVSGF